MVWGNRSITSLKNSTACSVASSENTRKYLQRLAVSIAVYWKYCLPATVPGTCFTSISTSSPGLLKERKYLYFTFFTRYFLTSPSAFSIFPIVRSWITIPSFSRRQCSLRAQSFVFFLSAMIFSLSLMGVSFGFVLGLVEVGVSAANPPRWYAAIHRSRDRLLYGHTLMSASQLTPSSIR